MAHTDWSNQIWADIGVFKLNLQPTDQISAVAVDNLLVDDSFFMVVSRPALDNPCYTLLKGQGRARSSSAEVLVKRADISVGVGRPITKQHILELKPHFVSGGNCHMECHYIEYVVNGIKESDK